MGDSKSTDTDVVSAKPDRVPAPGKKLKRVRKVRPADAAAAATSSGRPARLHRSPMYLALVLLRLCLIFAPGILEASEHQDGSDLLAARILPGISASQPRILESPAGMVGGNATRSIVGAVVSTGIPYFAVAAACKKAPAMCPPPSMMGYVAVFAPRVWMFLLSLVTDLLLLRVFAVYETENAVSAVVTYASTWSTLLAVTRNTNFGLESLCLTAIVAGCFGWAPGTARPLFYLTAMGLSLGTFLRPIFFVFIITPMIYLASLWGKSGVRPIPYILAAMEGMAIFAFWCSIWVSVDSIFYGKFKILIDGVTMESIDMFLDNVFTGSKFAYKGSLVYTPIVMAKSVLNKEYLKTFAHNTTPGQMFLSLPGILGPLFIVLMRESYKGMLVAVKELMAEVKAATNPKKSKKKKGKKDSAKKEREEELLVFFDTIQTTLLLGLLLEVVQNNDRLGIISLLSLIPTAVMCMPGSIFGAKSSPRFRLVHIIFTICMVVFYGLLHQSGVQRGMLSVGAGGVEAIPENSHVVVYRGMIGHRAALGPNVKNVTIHDGGESRLKLMSTLRELKAHPEYHEDRLFIAAAGTVDMKDHEFAVVKNVATGHMTISNMPQNIDHALKKSTLLLYKFIGDEDEAILRDQEEAEEKEEKEKEQQSAKEEL